MSAAPAISIVLFEGDAGETVRRELLKQADVKRAYAWERWETGEEPRYTVVLAIPPVNSANDAVKAAIMAIVKQL